MPTLATSDEFVCSARRSGLLDEAKFAERFPAGAPLPADPRGAADALTRAGLLTRFQADRLLAGGGNGLVLGPYTLLRPVGGKGTKFLAEHGQLKRKAVIEVLPIDPAAAGREDAGFLRRVRPAAALHHPNVVRFDDLYRDGGVPHIVTEYVDGTDLDELVKSSGRLPHVRAVHYAARAAAGLRHVHEKGLTHGDVRPGNLMVTPTGVVKVLGLVRPPRPGAPEPDAEVLDDVAALGATLYTLIAGKPPADGTARLSDAVRGVPPALDDVVARMMTVTGPTRLRTMGDVIVALTPWLAEAPTASPPAGRTTAVARPARPGRSGRRLWPLAAGIAVVAAVGLAAGAVYWITRTPQAVARGGTTAATAPESSLDATIVPPPPSLPPPPPKAKSNKSAKSTRPTAPAKPAAAPAPATAPAAVSAGQTVFRPLPLGPVAHTHTHSELFGNTTDVKARLKFDDWGPKEYRGVPFHLIDPEAGAVNNAVALYSSNRPGVTDQYPRSFALPVNAPVAAVHVLGGVAGWGFPFAERKRDDQPSGAPEGAESVVVRFKFADGKVEEHVWRNGEHITDYNKPVEATGSEVAFEVEPGRYVRYLVVRPVRVAEVKEIEFAKAAADEFTAPIFLAVTVEAPAAGKQP